MSFVGEPDPTSPGHALTCGRRRERRHYQRRKRAGSSVARRASAIDALRNCNCTISNRAGRLETRVRAKPCHNLRRGIARLQIGQVLRSWAVPRGPSLNPADKRLAVMVEDHPVEYGDFEGRIPEGNYGAGVVIVWDRGEYAVIDPPGGNAADAVGRGKLDIEMRGFKLRGAFTLVRTRRQDSGQRDPKSNGCS